MSTRELKNLKSTLLVNSTFGTRAQRLAAREATRDANEARYRELRENRGRQARNRRSQKAYMEGRTTKANYRLRGYGEVKRTLDAYLPALENGGKFIIQSDETYYTLSLEKYEDLMRLVDGAISGEGRGIDLPFSDGEVTDKMSSGGAFSIGNVGGGNGYNFRGGAYFPYTHDFDCGDLSETLERLGCFKEVKKENYDSNCLWNAFQSAGVSEAVLQAMKTQFLRRTISRRNIRDIAEQHNLYVEIHTDGDKDVVKYGDKDGFHVQVACIMDHYIHLHPTKFNSYAVEHYDDLKDKMEWWTFKDGKNRDKTRGMNSLNLLRSIMKTEHVHKISITTHGIFKTQFHDKANTNDFETLEYPESYSRPFHPKRDGGYDFRLWEPINMKRLEEILTDIRSREHGLVPDTRKTGAKNRVQREHNKVRDMREYLERVKARVRDGKLEVRYQQRDGLGRMMTKNGVGLQNCYSCLRPALIGHLGYDLDMVNSAPTIVTQWIDRLNREGVMNCEIEALRDYKDNRERWFAEICEYHCCEKGDVKKMVCAVLNGGYPHLKDFKKNPYRIHPWLRRLGDEMKVVHGEVLHAFRDEYKDLIKRKREEKVTDEEVARSVFATLSFDEENRCLMCLYNFLIKSVVMVWSLIFDGCIVDRCSDGLIDEAQKHVLEQTGYEIRLAVKPLHGLQNSPIHELECIKHIVPVEVTETECDNVSIDDVYDDIGKFEDLDYNRVTRMIKSWETIEKKDPALYERLEKKVTKLKLGKVEEAALVSRSRPVDANVFFDFEATTKQTHDKHTMIEACRKQIMETCRQPEKIIEKIETKVREERLDTESEAKMYQQECPHVAYQVCYSEFDEDVVHEYDGPMCAKRMLDDLVERYGCEVSPGEQLNSNDVPVIRMLAHNVTYDLSFLWQYLYRSNYIERGSSIVCGRARYVRFGNEREEGTRKNFPNGDLVCWMQDEGRSMYYHDPDHGEGRSMHRGVWERAVKIVKEHGEYLTEFNDFKKLRGIGNVIASIVECADFDSFRATPPFRYDKMLDIRFQDTYKTISMPLSDFGKSFKLDQAKEVMPYDMYTEEFVRSGGVATMEQLNAVPNFKDRDQLLKNLASWGCVVECEDGVRRYDMMKYSRIYCRADVDVLKKGWRVFRDSLLTAFDIDAFHYPTISSIGDAYLTEQGCYDGVHKIAGVPQRFIANASVGGRVMCAENKPVRNISKPSLSPDLPEDTNDEIETKKTLADFDGVSLYPSSMARIPGFLKGAPKVWDETVNLDDVDGYFVKIRVDKVGKRYRFPIARLKDDEGGNVWTNEVEGCEITVDKWTLEDLVRWSKIEYTVLQGYYFDQGRNATINGVIQDLFNMRLKYKKEDNPLQLVIKLIMNASYGICGLKPIDVDTRYITEGERKDNFINTNFNRIKDFTQMNNNEWRFELYKEIDTHFNRQHVACEILSVSKNIMNEVMCTAEDVGGPCIHYTDTDSMHIDDDMVAPLAEEFEKRYGRELIGKKLGQFHTDFDFSVSYSNVDDKLVPCAIKSKGEIKAVESVFLGKKSYIDLLEDDGGNSAYHIRLKGIPSKCIMHKVTTEYGGNPMLMFNDLFEGSVVEFDLSAGGAVMFKVNKNHTMSTVSMTRKVRFVNGEIRDCSTVEK